MSEAREKSEFQTVTIAGNSMDRAGLLDGMQVRMRLTAIARSGNVVVAVLADGSETIKRLRRSRNSEGDIVSWLVPVSHDYRHESRRMVEGDRIRGVLDMSGIEQREYLTRPPYVYKGRQLWAMFGFRFTSAPPRPKPKVPRYEPSGDLVPFTYGGLVGAGAPLCHWDGDKIPVCYDALADVHYCVTLASASLRGLGIEPGDTLFVREAWKHRPRGGSCPLWEVGQVVIAEDNGEAFAGELVRYGTQLCVRPHAGTPGELSRPIEPRQIQGVVMRAVAPPKELAPA